MDGSYTVNKLILHHLVGPSSMSAFLTHILQLLLLVHGVGAGVGELLLLGIVPNFTHDHHFDLKLELLLLHGWGRPPLPASTVTVHDGGHA